MYIKQMAGLEGKKSIYAKFRPKIVAKVAAATVVPTVTKSKITTIRSRSPLVRRFTPTVRKSVLIPTSLVTVAKENLPVSAPLPAISTSSASTPSLLPLTTPTPETVVIAPKPYIEPVTMTTNMSPVSPPNFSTPALAPSVVATAAPSSTMPVTSPQPILYRDKSEPDSYDENVDAPESEQVESKTSNTVKVLGIAGFVILLGVLVSRA